MPTPAPAAPTTTPTSARPRPADDGPGLEALRPGRTPRVVLSYGLGVDSTAILLRWLLEPQVRDFNLADLVVLTAMTGDEWARTGTDVETHILPLLRRHGVRYVQVARGRRHVSTSGAGIRVLDDSTQPTRLHLAGAYKLSDELAEAGTIPQSGGARLCSVHAKGDALDPVIARLTAGRSFRHVIGFEAGEVRRAAKDAGYNTGLRTGEYPLLDWGWDRARCEAYITETLGVAWEKSACVMCPFALGSKAGRDRTLARYAADPAAGVATIALEHTALALNPAQGLIGGDRVIDAVRAAGHHQVLAGFAAHLAETPHALYEVRRILRPRKDDPTKLANASRSVRTRDAGSRERMLTALHAAATSGAELVVGDDHIARVYLRRRGETLPTVEHFLVAAPAGVLDKEVPQFSDWWAALVDDGSRASGQPAA